MEQTHDSPTALELYKGHPVQEAAQIILGSLLFSASMNWIILPHDMYSGGFLGIAQLLRMLLLHFFPAIQQIGDLAGILYFLLNIPLLLISWFRFGHFFFAKTALCIVCYSAFLALIPIPAEGLFDETIAACVIGGLVCGVGAGMTLTAGCSGGGEEILGLLCVQKKPDFSVGRIAMILNVFVYGIGLLLFEQDVVDAFATDALLSKLGLTMLEDDLSFFPPYYAVNFVDAELLESDPELAEVLSRLDGAIDEATMAAMNAQVDVDGMSAQEVAHQFLVEHGLVTE